MDAFMDFSPFFYDPPVRQEPTTYEDYEFIYGNEQLGERRYGEFAKSAKIVELTDIGCDACAPEFAEKNKCPDDVKGNGENVFSKATNQAKGGIRTRRNRNYKTRPNFNSADDETLKKCPSPEDTKTSDDLENVFDTLKSRGTYEQSRYLNEINDKKRFTDRGIDDDDDCDGSTKKFEKSYLPDRTSENIVEPVKGDEKRGEKVSAIPRFVERSFEPKKSRKFGSKVECSKLPIWREPTNQFKGKLERDQDRKSAKIGKMESDNGARKKSHSGRIAKKKSNDVTSVDETFGKGKKKVEVTEAIRENMEKGKNDGKKEMCGRSGKVEGNGEPGCFSSLILDIKPGETEKTTKILSNTESLEKMREESPEDQSKSELWNEDYERAWARGRSVGLKIFRMAKAARDERKREFRKYGFENYNQTPRKMPQEILDIGVSLVEKVLDDPDEMFRDSDDDDLPFATIPKIILQAYLTNQLLHE